MKILLGIIAIFCMSAHATGLVDPFVNPLQIKERELMKLKEQLKERNKKVERKNDFFKPVINKPFEKLSIQGVIEAEGKTFLVLYDPETGETFLLKEGDAISSSEKIYKLSAKKVVLVKYFYKDGKIKKAYKTLNVNVEE